MILDFWIFVRLFFVFLISFEIKSIVSENFYERRFKIERLKESAEIVLGRNILMVGMIKGLMDDFFEKLAIKMDFN